MGLRLARIEHLHVGRKREPPCHLAFGVVVAVEQVNRNPDLVQPAHFAHKEVAGVEVLPIAVVQVAGNDDEVDRRVDGLVDQPRKGVTRGRAQGLHRSVRVRGQPAHRAVEVDVGGVDEFHEVDELKVGSADASEGDASSNSSNPLERRVRCVMASTKA